MLQETNKQDGHPIMQYVSRLESEVRTLRLNKNTKLAATFGLGLVVGIGVRSLFRRKKKG